MSVNGGTIVTIARQYGSGGREIGEKLAKKLGVPFYDKDLLAMAAKESGYSEQIFEKADERVTNSLLYSLLAGSHTLSYPPPPETNLPMSDKLFLIQSGIIKRVAQDGPCVIVGRCADYILRDFDDVLNVFVHADKMSRLERIVQKYGQSPEKSAETIAKMDKRRASYYNFYTSRRWGDAGNYHLTLDSSALGIDNTVDLIFSAAKMREKGGKTA